MVLANPSLVTMLYRSQDHANYGPYFILEERRNDIRVRCLIKHWNDLQSAYLLADLLQLWA
jgi:hypothetical protein